jgi:hypothetical protein
VKAHSSISASEVAPSMNLLTIAGEIESVIRLTTGR